MKRVNGVFERIVTWENLLIATYLASQGKRHRTETQQFCRALPNHLHRIRHELLSGDFCFGRFHQFVIHDPKERLITAPCFEERVVHHAIMNVCEPYFEKYLIDDTFACRKGRGRLAALARAQTFSRRYSHYLKVDVRKYFDSIHQATLLKLLERRFKDKRLLQLFAAIIGCHYSVNLDESVLGCGLPIGSLTSQHFANFYLSQLDRFVKERLQIKGYVRYMDDCLLWGDSRAMLRQVYSEITTFLQESLRLKLKRPIIANVKRGIDFLGCRLFPNYLTLNRRSRRRFRRKLMELTEQYRLGELSSVDFQQRSSAMIAFSRAGKVRSWNFRSALIKLLAADD